MKAMNPSTTLLRQLRAPASRLLLAAALTLAPAARAIMFELGDVKGSFDTTLSFGTLSRLHDPDRTLFGLAAGGLQRSVNADDGNLNFDKGIVSMLAKVNHDLQLDYKNMGAFVRGFYFTDFEIENGRRKKAALSKQARHIVGEDAAFLDAYVYFKPTLGDNMAARIAVGRQVLSWGESTFIPNGINNVNPFDVAKLRTPGSELKEALRPLNMVSASLSLTENLTADAFYLLDWQRTRVDPPGTFFSTNDFVAKGGTKVFLGFGAVADTSVLGPIKRGTDNTPGSSGQWGLALHYQAEKLNNTEFGLFFMNFHSRLPAISARTPTAPISAALVQQTAGALAAANLAPVMAPLFGANTPAAINTLLGAALTGVPQSALPANLQPFFPTALAIANGARTIGFLTAAQTGRFLIEFPEDIRLWGASFNTNVRGIALQGEVSYRDNQPLQVDDVELLFAALSSINPAFGPNNQIGNFLGKLDTYIPGFRRRSVVTGQMTATYIGRGVLGASQTTLLAEAGFVNANLPANSTLRFDGPATFVGGDLNFMTKSGNAASGSDPASAFADEFSWGYQLVGRLDYNNAFAGVNVSPLVTFAHDVQGNTPLPLGNFRENRKIITLGVDFVYQNAFSLELRYVNFFGAGRFNLLSDRDYVSTTVKYSF